MAYRSIQMSISEHNSDYHKTFYSCRTSPLEAEQYVTESSLSHGSVLYIDFNFNYLILNSFFITICGICFCFKKFNEFGLFYEKY